MHFVRWNFKEESVIPCDINATTVMILLVFTSISSLFQFSPNKYIIIKMCKLWSKFSKYISSCCLYDLCHLSFSSYNVSTNFSMVCLSALFRSFPSTISAPGTDGCNSLTVFPNPLPPDVANKTIFFPLKDHSFLEMY